MNPLPTLYSKTKKGKVTQWRVWTEGPEVVVEWGQVGGKLQQKRTTCKAKNVGRSNATTPEEQAILEAKSKWEHQILREDYHEDVEQSGKQIRAMLALDYTKVGHRVDWSQAVVQPKLDGLRLTAGRRYRDQDTFEMLTRKGEVYKLPHLEEGCKAMLAALRAAGEDVHALDGEVYLHGMPLQTISSYARAYKEGLTEQLEYHVFDLVMDDVPLKGRLHLLDDYIHDARKVCPNIWPVVTWNCFGGKDQLQHFHNEFSEYEGVMIRHYDSLYECGERSSGLFKYKEFLEDEFKIIDIWEDKNNNAMFTCVTKEGKEFDCTPKRTHTERKQMLNEPEKYIGEWLTVKYQALTNDGIPEFPVGLALRECNDMGEPVV